MKSVFLILLLLLTACAPSPPKYLFEINQQEDLGKGCIPFLITGTAEERMNLLILGYDYPNQPNTRTGKGLEIVQGDFNLDLLVLRAGLKQMQTDPEYIKKKTDFFSLTKTKMNFYAYKTDRQIYAQEKLLGDIVKEEAAHCPQIDYVLILSPQNRPLHAFIGQNIHFQSSSGVSLIPGTGKVVNGPSRIDLHEFGHAFGNMVHTEIFDLQANRIWLPQPLSNFTDTDLEGCPKWCSGIINQNAECFEQYALFLSCINGKTLEEKKKCLDRKEDLPFCDLGQNCLKDTGCYFLKQDITTFRECPTDIMLRNMPLEGPAYCAYTQKYMLNKVQQIIKNK